MTMDKMHQFRTAFLRSVAHAWTDPAFKKQLVESPTLAMQQFGFKWPWEETWTLNLIDADKDFQWLDDEWIWSNRYVEGLTLHVPLCRQVEKIDVSQRAAALADYYRQFALLGAESSAGGHMSSADLAAVNSVGPRHAAPAGGYLASPGDFAALQIVLLTALGKAWNDPSFETKLMIDAPTALHAIRGYQLPWKLAIHVKEAREATWDAGQSRWSFVPKNVLHLCVPRAPDDPRVAPLALATYNAAGAEYPFTCCCG
jgi:ribosomally synthesized peptide (two-chain TOMM family)